MKVKDKLMVTTSSGKVYPIVVDEVGIGTFTGKAATDNKRYIFRDEAVSEVVRQETSVPKSLGAVLLTVGTLALITVAVILSKVDIKQ